MYADYEDLGLLIEMSQEEQDEETVQEIEAGANMTPYTGYDITNPKNRFLNEIFKGTNRTAAPNKLLLYRLGATGQKQASAEVSPLTATAKYPGVRGNDISIVITELTDLEDAFAVSTVVGGEIVDQQTAKTVEELSANDWVAWSGTGALAATVGCVLPSCILVTLLARIYLKYRDLSIIQGVLKSLRPAVVAMIGAAGVSILVTAFWGLEGFSPNLSALNLRSVCIFAGAVVLLVRFRMSPILVMVLSGAAETACQLVMRVL